MDEAIDRGTYLEHMKRFTPGGNARRYSVPDRQSVDGREDVGRKLVKPKEDGADDQGKYWEHVPRFSPCGNARWCSVPNRKTVDG